MNSDDAIAHFCARMPNSEKTTFFVLGQVADAYAATEGIKEDIRSECCKRIPLPFYDTTLLGQISESSYMAFRFIERPITKGLFAENAAFMIEKSHKERMWVKKDFVALEPVQEFLIMCLAPRGEAVWTSQFCGVDPGGGILVRSTPPEPQTSWTAEIVGGSSSWCRLMAMISHPANYIVKETPQLTAKEAKRIESGKRFPDAKRSRYIIVDHDVLVNRLKPQGTHASPAPHQRRGHWMRLAEHCKHARARGIEKVWVRDCSVGETDFIVNGRRYQVLLDFQDRVRERR